MTLTRKTPMSRGSGFKRAAPAGPKLALVKKPAAEAKRRMRKCAIPTCRQPFEPRSMTHKACSIDCSVVFVEQEKAAKLRRERQAGLQALKSRADHAKEAQTAMNAWVRFRDRLDSCISCDKPASWAGQWHASHFISVGACQTTRFDPANLHKACSICNNHLSGNIRAYRPRLIAKIGQAEVDRLEGWHEPRKFSIEELKQIKAYYVAKLKEAKRLMA
jgi:hypothetical protein